MPEAENCRRRGSRALACFLAAALPALSVVACAASRRPIDRAESDEAYAHLRASLETYREQGLLTGTPAFPVVGSAHALPAGDDSAWVGFAASFPPSAMRFAREGGLYTARYQVVILVVAGQDTLHHIERRETVRVDDFPETVQADPVILFQRFLRVPADSSVVLAVTVRELASRLEANGELTVDASAAGATPLVVYRATPRAALDQAPPLILEPRRTTAASEPPPSIFVEQPGPGGTAVIEIESSGAMVWTRELTLAGPPDGPATAVVAFPLHDVPPGPATVRVRGSDGTVRELALVAGLSPVWVAEDWAVALDLLRYAIPRDTLSVWQNLEPEERGAAWNRLWRRSDTDSSTLNNEYFEKYFDRMDLANARFDEPGRAGWTTDRGEVLVRIGEPDRQRFERPDRQADPSRIVWEYRESVPSPAVIVFEDVNDFGMYVMTPRSRAILRRVERELAEAGMPAPEGS